MIKKKVVIPIIIVLLFWYLTITTSPVINNNDLFILRNSQYLVNLRFKWLPFMIPSNGMIISQFIGFNLYLIPSYSHCDFTKDTCEDDFVIDIIDSKAYTEEFKLDNESKDQRAHSFRYIGYDLYLKYSSSPDDDIIRSIDVFDNVKEVRPYYKKIQPRSMLFKKSIHFLAVNQQSSSNYLGFLSDFNSLKLNQQLMSSTPNFKIFQISDLHYLNGRIDYKTEIFLINSIKAEKPNLIIINGDLFNFQKFKFNNFSMILNALNLFISFKIPYIINFGDSDYISISKNIQMLKFISNLPYCLNSLPETESNGLTNYNFVLKNNQKNNIIGLISVLDTFENRLVSSQIHQLYRFNNDLPSKGSVDSDIFKLSFIHFPLPNFRPSGKFKIVGTYNEKSPLQTSTDKSFINDFLTMGYNVISASHEHKNDGCILHEAKNQPESKTLQLEKDIWLCYSSISGFQGLANDFDRKLRVFEIIDNRLLSWKISEKDGKGFDYQLIAGN
ncbi:hypothetical protein CLIB1444_01S00892 [[Candida] jaroonii]|uniref:Uncharacterized protein n=1 Tax=[Candida] jaroonii TaxID=467808 RepID=A0ACA9Y0Y0_9ASCO|nr:hypothetical protein CLIB1444_01S00892 [[Candida] jaroonii]